MAFWIEHIGFDGILKSVLLFIILKKINLNTYIIFDSLFIHISNLLPDYCYSVNELI